MASGVNASTLQLSLKLVHFSVLMSCPVREMSDSYAVVSIGLSDTARWKLAQGACLPNSAALKSYATSTFQAYLEKKNCHLHEHSCQMSLWASLCSFSPCELKATANIWAHCCSCVKIIFYFCYKLYKDFMIKKKNFVASLWSFMCGMAANCFHEVGAKPCFSAGFQVFDT